jgi:hypothetical protein
VAEPSDDLRQELKTVVSLVGDQDAKVPNSVLREASWHLNIEMPADGAAPLERE